MEPSGLESESDSASESFSVNVNEPFGPLVSLFWTSHDAILGI